MNLLLTLFSSHEALDKDTIRFKVRGYDRQANGDAFNRMFERDKADLREIGINIPTKVGPDGEERYYIEPNFTDEIGFNAVELCMIDAAGRMWQDSGLQQASMRALTKAKSTTEQVPASTGSIDVALAGGHDLGIILDSVAKSQRIRFDYRARSMAPSKRVVQPWKLLVHEGVWYLYGFDETRQDARLFRISRIISKVSTFGIPNSFEVPEKVDLDTLFNNESPQVKAHIALANNRGTLLRRKAHSIATDKELPKGWDEFELEPTSLHEIATDLVNLGSDVIVFAPPILRETVIEKLLAVRSLGSKDE